MPGRRRRVFGPKRFFFYSLFESDRTGAPLACANRARGSIDAYAAAVGRWLVTRDGFDFLVYYLPDYDYASHALGPGRARTTRSRAADAASRALVDAAGGLDEFLERYAVVLCSDHGQTRVERPTRLDAARRATSSSPRRTAPGWCTDDAARPRARGARRRRRRSTSSSSARTDASSRAAAARRSLALLDEYPHGRARVDRARCANPNAGEVLVSAAPGWEFADLAGGTTSAAAATARSCAGDSEVPMLTVGLGPPPGVDHGIAPLVLAHFGVGGPRRVPPDARRAGWSSGSSARAASATSACSPRWRGCRASCSSRRRCATAPTRTRRCRSACGQTISQPYIVALICQELASRRRARARRRHRLGLPGGRARRARRRGAPIERLPELAERGARPRGRRLRPRRRCTSATARSALPSTRRSAASPSPPRRPRCRSRSSSSSSRAPPRLPSAARRSALASNGRRGPFAPVPLRPARRQRRFPGPRGRRPHEGVLRELLACPSLRGSSSARRRSSTSPRPRRVRVPAATSAPLPALAAVALRETSSPSRRRCDARGAGARLRRGRRPAGCRALEAARGHPRRRRGVWSTTASRQPADSGSRPPPRPDVGYPRRRRERTTALPPCVRAARRCAPRNWVQLAKFGAVGASGYLVNLGVYRRCCTARRSTSGSPRSLVRRRGDEQLLVQPALDVPRAARPLRLPGAALPGRLGRGARREPVLAARALVGSARARSWRRRSRSCGHAAQLPRQQALVVPALMRLARRSSLCALAPRRARGGRRANRRRPSTTTRPPRPDAVRAAERRCELTSAQATQIFLAHPKVADWLDALPAEPARPTRRSKDRVWTVKVWSGEAGEIADRARSTTRRAPSARRGRGRRSRGGWRAATPGAFGGKKINSYPVWLGFCALFLLGLVDWRRPLSLRTLDLLALLSFSVSLWFFNHGDVFARDAARVPAARLPARALRLDRLGADAAPRGATVWPVWLLAAATVFSLGFRIGLNMATRT